MFSVGGEIACVDGCGVIAERRRLGISPIVVGGARGSVSASLGVADVERKVSRVIVVADRGKRVPHRCAGGTGAARVTNGFRVEQLDRMRVIDDTAWPAACAAGRRIGCQVPGVRAGAIDGIELVDERRSWPHCRAFGTVRPPVPQGPRHRSAAHCRLMSHCRSPGGLSRYPGPRLDRPSRRSWCSCRRRCCRRRRGAFALRQAPFRRLRRGLRELLVTIGQIKSAAARTATKLAHVLLPPNSFA